MPSSLRRLPMLAALFCLLLTGLVLPTAGTADAALPAGTSAFKVVTRGRVADTRVGYATGFTRVNSTTVRVSFAKRLPLDATTVVLNITAVGAGGFGAVTAYPTGTTAPATAHVLLTRKGQTSTGMAHVRLGTSRSVDIKYSTPVGLMVDMVGAYTTVTAPEGAGAGRFVPMGTGHRIITSQSVGAGGTALGNVFGTGVPSTASAVVLSLNSDAGATGYWAAYADGTPRTTTDMWIDTANQKRTNLTIVPLNGVNGGVRLWSRGGGRITVDVVGYYTGAGAATSTDGLFLPITNTTTYRRIDTRTRWTLAPMGPTTVEFSPGLTTPVSMVVGTLRVADGWDAGSIVTRPAGTTLQPMSAARVAVPREVFSVPFVARTSSRGVAVVMTKGAHVAVDVAGWFLGARPTATAAATAVNAVAATQAVKLRWRDAGGTHLKIIEIASKNDSYTTTIVANRGNVVGYTGISTLGKTGNTMLFAHRTTHGGSFYNIHTMAPGATFSIQGANGKWHNYRVVARNVTSPYYTAVNAIAGKSPPVTAQLVACSKADGTPTSTSYRIVITGILVSITNT